MYGEMKQKQNYIDCSGMGRTGASLTTGRTRFPVDVLTSAERAMASVP